MCTTIGATGKGVAGGGALVGSVSDDPYDIRTRVVVRRPQHGHAFIGTDLAPLESETSAAEYSASISGLPTRAVNDQGLAFTWALAFERRENAPSEGALKAQSLWTEVMTRCATVAEAVDLIERLPRDIGAAALLADAAGNLVRIEIGRRRVAVTDRLTPARGGFTVTVNCWTVLQAEDGEPGCSIEVASVPNRTRLSRAEALLRAADGAIDLAALRRVLTDHVHRDRFAGDNTMLRGHGFSICNHGSLHKPVFDKSDPAWGSVSAEIIDPTARVLWYAYGWPCGERPEHGDQLLQDRSWGCFIGFPLAELAEGAYTTLTGKLTPLAARHFGGLLPWPEIAETVAARATAAE